MFKWIMLSCSDLYMSCNTIASLFWCKAFGQEMCCISSNHWTPNIDGNWNANNWYDFDIKLLIKLPKIFDIGRNQLSKWQETMRKGKWKRKRKLKRNMVEWWCLFSGWVGVWLVSCLADWAGGPDNWLLGEVCAAGQLMAGFKST